MTTIGTIIAGSGTPSSLSAWNPFLGCPRPGLFDIAVDGFTVVVECVWLVLVVSVFPSVVVDVVLVVELVAELVVELVILVVESVLGLVVSVEVVVAFVESVSWLTGSK